MQVVLVMFRPDGQRRSFSVVRDMTVIGRRDDCDLRIPLGDVSRKHCRLIKDGETLRVEDLGSSNGTYRNGTRIQQSELTAGDTLQVGPVVFVLQVDGMPADEDLQPVTAGGGAGAAEGEEELEVVEDAEPAAGGERAKPGEFDPMEALNVADGSGFEFHMEEEAAAAAAAAARAAEGESDVVDMGEEPPAELEEAPAEIDAAEEAPVELDAAEAEEAPVALDAAEEAPVELDPLEEADEVVDLEESEEKQ
ncbi:MAG TPA: FHA domain-containing protein [Tepidisphaeraceae bacterium]|nr:FHA domain-containing protein [Tepidisphaeraceae bacterium]